MGNALHVVAAHGAGVPNPSTANAVAPAGSTKEGTSAAPTVPEAELGMDSDRAHAIRLRDIIAEIDADGAGSYGPSASHIPHPLQSHSLAVQRQRLAAAVRNPSPFGATRPHLRERAALEEERLDGIERARILRENDALRESLRRERSARNTRTEQGDTFVHAMAAQHGMGTGLLARERPFTGAATPQAQRRVSIAPGTSVRGSSMLGDMRQAWDKPFKFRPMLSPLPALHSPTDAGYSSRRLFEDGEAAPTQSAPRLTQ
jgi:hypothetical protein